MWPVLHGCCLPGKQQNHSTVVRGQNDESSMYCMYNDATRAACSALDYTNTLVNDNSNVVDLDNTIRQEEPKTLPFFMGVNF